MTEAQQRTAAKRFIKKWTGKGQEDEDARSFWIDILQDILGVDLVTDRLDFEKKVIGEDGNTKRIDVYIPETRVLIEQKSLGIALDKPQAGHKGKTPYEQAKEYDNGLLFNEKSRWIVTSNFSEIWVYDMNQKKPDPVKIPLSDLATQYHMLDFLVNKETDEVSHEMRVSLLAGEIVGQLYNALRKQYKNPDSPESLRSLNKLCVRIVFCLYGEDAGLFKKKALFHDYMAQFDAKGARKALVNLFKILDQKIEERDPYLQDDDPILATFPYVNGGLFRDEPGAEIEIPPFTDEIRDLLLSKASHDFDWSEISPTIFGAVFESTLNPETRRSGGMHYTSVENIHKVIDPLFLNELTEELEGYMALPAAHSWRTRYLKAFQEKLASLEFLDPACGSGNFLTESYLSIRKLENRVIRDLKEQSEGQMFMAGADEGIIGIKVSIAQFSGIEINDFAVSVAKTAMWIAEAQMMQQTLNSVDISAELLPLATSANIVEGNALRMDWNDVVDRRKLTYIMGNPPFVGARLMGKEQKDDVLTIFGAKWKNVGNLDYVCCWYKKAAEIMQGTKIRTALVSTNSVTQGETVGNLWKPLMENGVHIDFAHRTFIWDSEASIKAHVHCVIVGFSVAANTKEKVIYSYDGPQIATNINGYLLDAPNVFVESRSKALADVPTIIIGSQPIDDSNFLFETEDEKNEFVKKEPASEKYIHLWYGSREFINRVPRYCLYLGDCSPADLMKMPECLKRVENVRYFRLSSNRPSTVKAADYPAKFGSTAIPDSDFVILPKVSSENRRYIPMGFMTPDVLCSDLVFLIPHATLYHFGILMSNVHMAWMRAVCGRLKSDYRYSKDIVYNNFPWPESTDEQRATIEKTAQMILSARELYPESSFADMYGEHMYLYPELLDAHKVNDKAVMKAYGLTCDPDDEAAIVAHLMKLYQDKTAEK